MFRNKNWTLSGVKTVLSKKDWRYRQRRTLFGTGRPRTARSPNTISDMAAKQSGLNGDPIDYAVWGSYKSVCTTTIESRTCKSCAKQE